MQSVRMISIVVVLEHHFPIPLETIRGTRGGSRELREFVVLDDFLDVSQTRRQGFGIGVEIHEDEALPNLHLEARPAVSRLFEVARSAPCRAPPPSAPP